MAKFVLTAELNLQGPKNIGAIVNQINNQLKDVKINTQIQGAASAIRDIETIKKSTDAATASANKMGYAFGVSLKRFAAFSIASRAIGLFSNKLAGAIDDAISFQNEMVRLSQITGQSIRDLKGVSDQIGDLASSLGVTSKSILSVADILAQAGLQANDLKVAINALAKTELAPTFGKIEDTAEGAVAILAQFGEGVGALEQQLGAINKVAARFAVESEDLISVVRRTGGVFKASGGSLEELLAVFTSVRATTRESAESIATGLRTIFTRIQRPKTIEYLKQFGVQLTDLNGKFVGPYKAVQQLSEALSQFEEGDVRFIQIAEELGGYRQIGKVIPLVRQFAVAERARQAALEGATSLDEDVATSQQSLQRQFIKTQEAFLKLIRDVSNTTSFQTMVKIGLDLANAFIKVADSVKPLIPLIGALFAVRVARGLGNFAAGIGAGFGKVVGPQARNSGGKIHAFARGGLVPGSGNRDTVPAMLSPGEFVIRKSSVNKIGAGRLAAMNNNKYMSGGRVKSIFNQKDRSRRSDLLFKNRLTSEEKIELEDLNDRFEQSKTAKSIPKDKKSYPAGVYKTDGGIAGFFLTPEQGSDGFSSLSKDIEFYNKQNQRGVLQAGSIIKTFLPYRNDLKKNFELTKIIDEAAGDGLKFATSIASVNINKALDILPQLNYDDKNIKKAGEKLSKDKQVYSTVGGYIFEGMIQGISGAKLSGGRNTFDFPNIAVRKSGLAKLFTTSISDLNGVEKADAKRSKNSGTVKDIFDKTVNDLINGKLRGVKKLASGGPAPSDTVPALLTPGEFVINKKSAQRIGYGNLNRMNKRGVAGFAKGGGVGVQKFAVGGSPTYSFNNNANVLNIDLVKKSIEELKKTFLSLRQSGLGLEQAFEGAVNFIKSSSSDTSGVIPEEAQIIIAEERKRVKEASKNEKKATSSAPQYFTNGDLDLDTALQIGQLKDSFKRLKAAGLNNSDALEQSALDINNATEKTKAYIQAEQKRIEAIKSENKVPAVRNRTSPNTKSSAQPSAPVGNNQPVKALAAPNAEKDLNAVFVKFSVLTGVLNVAGSALSDMAKNADGSSTTLSRLTDALLGMVTQVSSVIFALQSFGVSLNSQNIKAFFKSTGPNSIGNKVFGGLQRNLAAKAATPKSGIFGGITRGLAGGGSNILGVLSKVAGPLALIGTSATLVSSGFNTIISSLYDFDNQLKSAIETGNAEKATKVAGDKAALEAANTTRAVGATVGAAFGAFLGPLGSAVGAIIGAVGGTVLAKLAPGLAEQINIFFGGDTTKSAMAKANADALAAKYTLELAANAKEAEAATTQWQLGLISTEQAMNSWGKNASNAANAFAAEMSAIDASQANKGGTFRDIVTIGGLLGETSTQRNTRIDKENADRAKQAFQGLNTEFENIMSGPLAKQLFLSGASGQEVEAQLRGQSQFSEVFKQLDAAANSSDAALSKMAKQAIETARKQAEAQAKQIANQKAYFDALNVGLSNFENRARAATSAMEMIQNQGKGMSSLGRSVEFLQAATTDQAAALDPKEIQANIKTFGAELLAAGADAKSVAKAQTALTATATAQRALRSESTLESLRQLGRSGQVAAQGPDITKSIIDLITKDITDEAQKTQIRSTLQDIEVDDKTLAALSVQNLDPLIQQYAKALQEGAANVALGAGTQLIKAEETLAKAMMSRVEAENRASDATIKSIDMRLKADERIASLGGPRVTSRQREAASIQKISAALAGTGIGLGAGTTRDLSRASQQIAGQIAALEQKRTAGTFTQQDEATLVKLKDANAKLLEQTEERFQIAEQELETAKKKVSLEKSAFEKLLSGDIEGAMEAQRGAAAAKLLQGGNAGIAAMLGGKASLAGLQLLQETGASDATLQRASMTIGSAYGISPALADAFAGTTPEEKAAKQRAIDLANVQKTQAAGIETVAGAELQTQIDLETRQQQAMQSMRTGQSITVGTATIPIIPAAAPAAPAVPAVPGVPTVPAAVSPAAVAAATTPPQAVSTGVGAGFINEQGISDKAKKAREAFVKGNSYGGIGRALANAVGTPTGSAAGVPAGATGMGISPEVMTKFTTSVESFSAAVNKLEGLKINIKIDPTNVNVNFNTGGSFIGSLTEGAKAEIGSIVNAAIKGSRVGQDGNIIPGNSSPLGTSV